MKRFLVTMLFLLTFVNTGFANDGTLLHEKNVQNQIDLCGAKIMNSNQIKEPVVFVYGLNEKKNFLKSAQNVTSRQVIVYANDYKYVSDENELAAFLSREIALAVRSYDGIFKGMLRSLQMKASPKKFEIVADKIAVDYMVKADYNPIALITYIQKTSPQKHYDTISTKNLTSKRLAIIYEQIFTKYPYFLTNNTYLDNEYYQNFLLNSVENRQKLEAKLQNNSTYEINYD